MDFFKSTLSSNGLGKMANGINQFLSRLILKTNNKTIYKYSGLFHLLTTFLVWLLLLILGSFFIFISSETMVVNFNTNAAAGLLERFYYTCYVLTTVGIGDFVPGNELSRLFTSLISFSGFIMLTTGISYLINILSGVAAKKNLASYIYGMGNNLDQLYDYCEASNDGSNLIVNSSQLRQLITSYTSQYWSSPIIHYFFSTDKEFAVEVQVARLYEVLNVMKVEFGKGSNERAEISSLENAVNYLLNMSLGQQSDYDFQGEKLLEYRKEWGKYEEDHNYNEKKDKEMDALLESCGWSWRSVFKD